MLLLDGHTLTTHEVVRVAREGLPVGISVHGYDQLHKSRAVVERVLQEERPVYGISTGFGQFANVFIDKDQRDRLQRNLILSHATGVGEFLPEDVVRACMLLRANSVVKGYSGVRASTVEALLELLNRGVCPAVPCKGSVGASGDLAPLSHIILVLLGEGECIDDGKLVPSAVVLEKKAIQPITLRGKEGLGLINGTQVMTGIGCLVWHDAVQLMKIADIAAAMSLEALRGTRSAYDERIAIARPHRGHVETSRNILNLTEDSNIIRSHKDCAKVQDAYSLRCVPQVHGASKDMVRRLHEVLEVEINAATDNPLIMPDTGEIISGGNFHGQPMALMMDALKIAVCEIANISERRINRLLDSSLSDLPAFLTAYPGVDSGFMITQYTAASLVSENKVLAHPASVDSIPTSANQEDHVSMGTIAARQCREILENARNVLAIELLAAAQGIDFLGIKPGRGTHVAHQQVRTVAERLDEDRYLAPDLRAVFELIRNESLVRVTERVVGELRV